MKRRMLLGLAWCVSCQRAGAGVVERAEFGVFFGGQVQELKELKKQLGADAQKHGFRLTFRAPLVRDLLVTWEVSLPASEKGGPRPALVGQTSARAGQSVLDVALAFRPTDPLGSWHALVKADGQVVIDRDFAVVAP